MQLLALARKRRALVALVLLLMVALACLAARGRVTGAFGGAYGNYFDLLGRARPTTLLRAFLFPPVNPDAPSAGRILWAMSLIAVFVCLLAAARKHPRQLALCAAGLTVSLTPVVWVAIAPNSMAGGRLLYAPGIFVAIALGLGATAAASWAVDAVASSQRQRSAAGFAGVILLGMWAAQATWSFAFQRTMWLRASALARSCIRQFGEQTPPGSDVYITNLPYEFSGGPYVLKCYGPSHYFTERRVRVRADRVYLRCAKGPLQILHQCRDSTSQYASSPNERTLSLQLE